MKEGGLSSSGAKFAELFLQEASEHLQLLREYGSVLLDPYPAPEDLERLYVAAHTLKGSSAMYGYPLFSEIGAKLAHVFQYAANVGLKPDAAPPLVEFVSEAVAVLEADLLMVSGQGVENSGEIAAFKQKYPFAFQSEVGPAPLPPLSEGQAAASPPEPSGKNVSTLHGPLQVPVPLPSDLENTVALPPDSEVGPEILEFFVPEAEEHLQAATASLLSLESNPNPDEVNRLFRAVHTLKGAAAQVGLSRIAWVAYRAEDVISRIRESEVPPDAELVDLCLDFIDVLKKFVYRQWADEETVQRSVKVLVDRLARLVPTKPEEEEATQTAATGAGLPAPAVSREAQDQVTGRNVAEGSSLSDASGTTETGESFPGAPPSAVLSEGKDQGGAGDVATATSEETVQAPSYSIPPEPQLPATPISAAETLGAQEAVTANLPDLLALPSDWNPIGELRAPAAHSEMSAAEAPLQPVAEVFQNSRPSNALPGLNRTGESPVSEGEPARKSPAVPPARSVRIALERLDRMLNDVGGLVINRTRMLGRLAELEQLADVLNFSKARMADKIVEFQDKYEFSRLQARSFRNEPTVSAVRPPALRFPYRSGYSSYSHSFDASLAEFSELEMDRYDDFSILSRSLTEISADITEILSQLDAFVRRADSNIDEFTKLARRLEDEITQARRVPIGHLYTRLSRTLRDAAKAAGKRIELELAGAETELDTNLMQQIADPLLHLLRNALAHGIESEEERYHLGKPDHGKVAVRAHRQAGHVFVEVEDDGRGIDWEQVRAAAVNLGLAAAPEAAALSEAQLQDLLFHPGFSTAPRTNEWAGRGVGLDVVRTNVRALNGEIAIDTQPGLGTRFTLKLPLTLIISQALFVRAGKQVFAFPLACVDEIRRIRATDIEAADGKLWVKVRDTLTEILRLDQQLGLEPSPPAHGYHVLVLVNVAGKAAGILVEEVLRKDEIVVKNLGEYLRNVKLFAGATIAPDGSLILLVDIGRLVAGETVPRRPLMAAASLPQAGGAHLFSSPLPSAESGLPETATGRPPEEKIVLLADDSISVRKFVGRMLEKAGYRVELAADGMEALEILGQTHCDLVITDLEMPRTNGYELMAHLRQDAEMRAIPILVVTSRAGAKHRDKALKLGAVDFLVKPIQEEQFLAAVHALIGPGSGTAARTAPLDPPEVRT